MLFLGTSDPPVPDAARDLRGEWWAPILVHLFLFGVLGILVSVSATVVGGSKRMRANLMVVVLVGTLWGLFTELFQTAVPGRGPEIDDLLANAVGSVLGGLSAWTARLWTINSMAAR